MEARTIIIGAGMAGMSCAHRLQEAGEPFLLITDELGGRVRYDPDTGINFGAYFVMSTYRNARKLLQRGSWINPADACFHNSPAERFSLLSSRTISLLPELVRFLWVIREFTGHYAVFKDRCLQMPHQDALQADPYMQELFLKPASEYIREKGFERAASDFVSKFSYACTGVSPEQLSALDFLNVSTGMLVPIHKFIFNPATEAARLGDALVLDTITAIESAEGRYKLTGNSGFYHAENVVVATPAAVTQQLLGLNEIRAPCQLYVYHLDAALKPLYRRFTLNLFPPGSEIILIVKEHDDSYLVYARKRNPDLSLVCVEFSILREQAWEKAMYVHGNVPMQQVLGDGLYTAGDHNALGLEPASISGIFAANQIIGGYAAVQYAIH